MGQQVSATEIEEVVLQHNAIKECAVIGVPSELEGELPTAVVVLKEGGHVTEEDIVHFVDGIVADYKKIR